MNPTSAPVERVTVTFSERAERSAPGVRLLLAACLLLLYSLTFFGYTSPPHIFAPVTQSADPSVQAAGGEALFTAKNKMLLTLSE